MIENKANKTEEVGRYSKENSEEYVSADNFEIDTIEFDTNNQPTYQHSLKNDALDISLCNILYLE